MLGYRTLVPFIAFSLALTGCELHRENQPSVLVVAIEGLGIDQVSCDLDETEDQTHEGFQAFCQESVRFSHAYSPSPLSQASVATLLTGLYPFDHGVHHNGKEFLSAKFTTLAEGALKKGYRTLFVSGGVPIWRKSGLAQGFEVFDDTMDLGLGTYYRPAEEVIKVAMNWVEQAEASPYLAVLFVNDLQFPRVATKTRDGEVRETSAEGQLSEVDESIGVLVKWLKAKKKWNSTHVVVVGLNSNQRRETDTDPVPLSLKSSSVQVPLFIKPARRERDNVIQWAIDRNVSLADVGRTMFDWLGLTPMPTSIEELAPENLKQALNQSEPDWSAERMVGSETAWPDWLEGSGVRWALRQNQFLFVNDLRPLIYNTFTDRMESQPLKLNDPLWTAVDTHVTSLISRTRIPRWQGMKRDWLDQIVVARELWDSRISNRRERGDAPWSRWYFLRALKRKDWRELRRLAHEARDPVAGFIAAKGLGENPPIPRNACLKMILSTKGDTTGTLRAECEDEGLLALHSWQTAKSDEEKNLAQERFVRLFARYLMDQEIGRLNYLNELKWDVDRDWPRAPSMADYILSVKEMEPFAKKTLALLNGKDFAF